MAPFSIINSSTGLDDYLDRVRRRLRASLASRGLGALALTALLVTVCGVYVANKLAFSTAGMAGARALLIAAVAAVAAVLLVRPLRGLSARRAADEAERRSPAFGGRLDAWVDQTARARGADAPANPLLDLLREDTLRVARTVPLDDVVGRGRILAFIGAAIAGLGALAWLGTSGPGYWQYGTSRLWTGWFLSADAPLYEFLVEPGDTTVRKGANLAVSARPIGFDPAGVDVYAKFESSVDWEKAPMGPQLEGSGYEFTFSAVREPLRYYVVAGRVRTREFNVDVVAMPNVESIGLEYEFPAWTGLDPLVEDPGGDIRAVKGTKVKVTVTTDKPLRDGILAVGEERIALRGAQAEIEVADDGEYHVAAVYRGEDIRLTDDFFITVVPDEKPVLEILEPARDWKATGIEEVMARFKAGDDFGLRSLELRYSVNGVEQPKIAFGGVRGKKEFRAGRLFQLEELGEALVEAPAPPALAPGASAEPLPPPAPPAGLIPGDLISYYATASDGRNETRTDIYFIEIQPFNRSFSQSQQSGGGGQGGGQQDEISRREKEIIVATWNLIKERDAGDGRKSDELRESAAMLAELQATLMSQATTLAERARARQLTASDPKFKQFVEYMEKAAEFMKPAADALAAYELDDAVGPEQQALQYLLRAESIFTDIQISMNRNGGGGGGGAARRAISPRCSSSRWTSRRTSTRPAAVLPGSRSSRKSTTPSRSSKSWRGGKSSLPTGRAAAKRWASKSAGNRKCCAARPKSSSADSSSCSGGSKARGGMGSRAALPRRVPARRPARAAAMRRAGRSNSNSSARSGNSTAPPAPWSRATATAARAGNPPRRRSSSFGRRCKRCQRSGSSRAATRSRRCAKAPSGWRGNRSRPPRGCNNPWKRRSPPSRPRVDSKEACRPPA